MINWNDQNTWTCPVPGYVGVPDVFEALGRKIFADLWTGEERQVVRVQPIPEATEVYELLSRPESDYEFRYEPGAQPGLTSSGEYRIKDYSAYNVHSSRAANLAGMTDAAAHPLSFAQWQCAYDASLEAARRWDEAAERRKAIFTWMHRRAADGALQFVLHDQSQGLFLSVEARMWNCSYDVARARFLRGAISYLFAFTPPPSDRGELNFYNQTFGSEWNLYAADSNVVDVLAGTVVEQVAEAKPDLAAMRVEMLLKAAASRAAAAAGSENIPPADPVVDEPEPVSRRGRRPKWDWSAMLGELIRIADEDGLTDFDTQADVERWAASWFSSRCGGEHPSESAIREKIAPIFKARDDNNALKKAGN